MQKDLQAFIQMDEHLNSSQGFPSEDSSFGTKFHRVNADVFRRERGENASILHCVLH